MIKSFSFIELYVTNLYQATFFYKHAFNFNIAGTANMIDVSSNYLKQGNINLILTAPLYAATDAANHIQRHGVSIKDISFIVDDVDKAFLHATTNGIEALMSPRVINGPNGKIKFAKVKTFGSVVHTLLEPIYGEDYFFADVYGGEKQNDDRFNSPLFNDIDHIAICVKSGNLNYWADLYAKAFNLTVSHSETIDTGKSGMNSKVLSSENEAVKIVFTETMECYPKSQIEEFIRYNDGPGVQHIAMSTDDILKAAMHLTEKGISLLNVPQQYYDMRLSELPELRNDIEKMKAYNILIDKDQYGELYQVFTQLLQTRPTGFFEIIQRNKAKGFGSDNIKALFKAIELEQEKRYAI